MKSVKQVLMDRDDMLEEDAEDLIESVREEINFAMECGDYTYAEDIMMYDLGLEMDYIFEFV